MTTQEKHRAGIRVHPVKGVCERCGRVSHVHRGMCERCRRRPLMPGGPVGNEEARPPRGARVTPTLHRRGA